MSSRWIILAVALCLIATLAPRSRAQCQPTWQNTPVGTVAPQDIVGGDVLASCTWVSPTGPKVVVGGTFTQAGNISVNHIAMWDGTAWYSLGSGIAGFVYGLAVFNGDLIVCGQFNTAGGVACNYIARYDGTSWHPLGLGLGTTAYCMVNANGTLYVGGEFTTAGGINCSRIAAWNGTAWSALSSGLNNTVRCMVFDNPNGIIIGGDFTLAFIPAGSVDASHVVRWNGAWSALGNGLSGTPSALGKFNNQIYAGGAFTSANGTTTTVHGLAVWNGSTWASVNGGVGIASGTPTVTTLFTFNNTLYIGGNFNSSGGVPCNQIASYDGTACHALGTGTSPAASVVNSMTSFQNCVIPSGSFTSAGGLSASKIARWNGNEWSILQSQVNGTILTLSTMNSSLIAGGAFNFLTGSGNMAYNVVGYSSAGVGSFTDSHGFSGPNGPVYASCPVNPVSPFLPQSSIIAGAFASASGQTCNNIASLSNLSEYAPMGSGFNNTVTAVRQYNNAIYAAGHFTASGSTSIGHIARYTSGGWVPVGASGANGGTPYVLAVYNGSLYMGGDFTGVDGGDTGGLARWDGTSWHIMGGHFAGTVNALTVYNNLLIIGGSFPGTQNSPNIATWNGGLYTGLGAGLGVSGSGNVSALAVHNGELYAAGSFAITGVPTLVNLAKWNGSAWVAIDTSITSGFITSLQSFSGTLWAGGSFTNASGHFEPYIAQLFCSCYVNCDNSSVAPLLNANDFQCFLNAFAAGDLYANCDGSAVIPYLNANDFQCFLNAFAAGCN